MNRYFTLVVTGLLIVGAVGAVPGVLAQSTTETSTTEPPASDGNTSVAPGERLAGVVGVGKAEVGGEVSARAFGYAFANASTNRTRAALIGRQVGDLDQRLATLRERQRVLRQAQSNGSISEGRYRAEMAQVVAQVRAVNRLTNESETAARGVPAEQLQRHGVNATAIQRLRSNAGELTGPEAAAIARSIAGPRAGNGMSRGPPSEIFGPGAPPGQSPGPNVTAPGPGSRMENGSPTNDTDRPGGPDTGPATQDRPGMTDNRSDGQNRGGRG